MDANPATRSRPSTPPSYQPQQNTRLHPTKSTPRRILTTASKNFAQYPLPAQRDMLIRDLGSSASVPCASLDFFEAFLLPKLTREHREEIFRLLQENGTFLHADPTNPQSFDRWSTIPFVRNASRSFIQKEAELYLAFENTCKKVVEAAGVVLNRSAFGEVRDTATFSWVSQSPQCKFRSDCDMVRLKIGNKDAYLQLVRHSQATRCS